MWSNVIDTPFPPIARRACGDGRVYVEWANNHYWLICEERGTEYWRREAEDIDDAAFELISTELMMHAIKKERSLRPAKVPEHYSRWNWMYLEIEMMGAMKASYGIRAKQRYAEVLQRAPLSQEERLYARYPINLEV